ncbi:MAG TPA: hypothetical protein VFB32_01165 [Rudaea sp.]|nr:hypothetical protein [Rudaea sp.]
MKRPTTARERLRLAQRELAAAEDELAQSVGPWRARLSRHRGTVIVAAGFVSGMALSLLPVRVWARIGALVSMTAAQVARTALTPAMIGAAVSRLHRGAGDGAQAPPANP